MYSVKWAWKITDEDLVMIEMNDGRPIEEIAADFDGLTNIIRKSKNEADVEYAGYNELIGVNKDKKKGTVLLTLRKGDAA